VLVGIDSLRSDRLVPPTGVSEAMPFTSRLVKEKGIVFPNTYVQLPRTFPSWVSMLTSTHPATNGVRTMFPSVESRRTAPPTLPQVLAAEGWDTAVYSDFAGDIFTRYPFGFATTRAPTFNFVSLIRLRLLEASVQLLPYLHSDAGRRLFPELREMAQHALPEVLTGELLDGMHRSDAAGRSAFSLVFYSTAHFPYAAPYPAYRRFASPDYGGPHRFQRTAAFMDTPGSADVAQLRGLYDGGLWAVDRELERLVAELERTGLASRTTLVITADHGENLFEGTLGIGHGDHLLGEHSLRVPLAIVELGEAPGSGRVEPERVRALDLAPTLARRVGVEPPPSFQGVDLLAPARDRSRPLPILTETELWFVEDSAEPHQRWRFRYPSVDAVTRVRHDHHDEVELQPEFEPLVTFAKHLAFVEGDEKLVYMPMRPRPQWRLYDVATDPDGAHDLAAERPDRVEALRRRMVQELGALGAVEERAGFLTWVTR
ncbi:MAG: sulfatase-like hydrolase/transferase, partial [Myxococcales bacterium]